jgi:NADH dehydrogenase/NADH:ubiquinone oxidoreductase subunit G
MFKRDYRSFWAHAKNISKLFKELKPLKKEDREELWSRFSSTCDETKQKQQTEHQERLWKSKSHRSDILSEISSAEVNTLFGFDPPDVEEMKRLSQVLKRAGQMLSDNKSEMLGEHKQECFEEIKNVRRAHDAWWADLTRHRDRKRENFQSRVRENLEKNYARHRKATEALRSCERSADELRDKISSAYNDDWASDARGWLSDLEDKISDIERSIDRIEDWIQEDEAKLR